MSVYDMVVVRSNYSNQIVEYWYWLYIWVKAMSPYSFGYHETK
jgi:hypothetical protein